MLRWFVAFTPIGGAIILPLVVPFIVDRFGIGLGVFSTLLLSSLWFVAMLRTSEMPH
ncbi:hypothetical protein [Prochlorococcus marinus]|uniref:Membrane protein n=1 Tax=Prochlorococcus marinus (strain MIT 9211) TaxID=93059 RepID=A9B9G1_PROM4|nr:hypothetical protein [Prochlorococcus marinus]ABX08016.1 membrane protein [Prochlorococcus marinus str. MIT 9211]